MKKILLFMLSCIMILAATSCSGGIGPEGISKAEYDQLQTGMTAYEVDGIIGGHGEKVSEKNNEDGSQEYIYEYQGETSGYARLTFIYKFNEITSLTLTAMEQNGLQ